MIRLVATLATVTLTAASLTVAGTAPGSAKDDDRREKRISGPCSKGARWDLKVKERDGGVEVEFEVDSNRGGQRWQYTVSQNGSTVMSGSRRTGGRSGSFSVERAAASSGGALTVTGRALNLRTREVCLGTLTL